MKKNAGGRKRIITPKKDRYVSPVAKRNRHVISSKIAADLAVATGTHNSARIILLQLNEICMLRSCVKNLYA